jgi:hypothetical protein
VSGAGANNNSNNNNGSIISSASFNIDLENDAINITPNKYQG